MVDGHNDNHQTPKHIDVSQPVRPAVLNNTCIRHMLGRLYIVYFIRVHSLA